MKTTSNIIRYTILGGLFIIPFIVFLVPSGMFFPFIVGKGFAFRIIVEILFGLFVALAFVDKEYRPKVSWLSKSILLFMAVMLVADLLGQNPFKSIWSNYERMEGFMLILHLGMFYFVTSSVLKTKEIWNWFFNTTIFASVLMSFYGLLQLAGAITISQGGARLDGTLGNSAYMAIYLVFHIFLSAYMMVSGFNKTFHKWIYGSIIFLETLLLYYTATRGAILGIIGGIILTGIVLAWKEKENKTLRKVGYYTLAGVAVFIVGFLLIKNTAFVKNSPVLGRFSTMSVSELQTQGRYFVWPMAVKGIAERPLLGWGQENFNFVFNKYYNPGLYGQEEWFDRTHDLILDWLIAGGILGFLSYVSIYVALFYLIWRKKSTLKLLQKSILTGLVSAYVFHNIFVFDNLISYIIFFSVLAYVHFMATDEDQHEHVSKFYTFKFSGDVLYYIVLPLVGVATLGMIYFVNVPAIMANTTLIQAMSPQNEGGVEKNLELFKKVFSYNSLGSSEALEQMTQIAVKINSAQQVSAETKTAFNDFAKLQIEKKLASTPTDARYLVFAGSYYNQMGQYETAAKYLERAIVESPKKLSIHFELGSSYLGLRETQKAYDLFKRAYELRPDAPEAQVIYAVGAIYAKDTETAQKMFSIIPEEKLNSDTRILKALIDVGSYDMAITIINKRLEVNPADLQSEYNLAEVYLRMGQKQKATTVIRKMIEQEPRFKEQGETFIKQMEGQ